MVQKKTPAKRRAPLIVGNWKMNPTTLADAQRLFIDIRNGLRGKTLRSQIVTAPPFVFMGELQKLSPTQRISLAAQDAYYEPKGAHTGEISLPMLKSVGVASVIIGHSERRAKGVTDVQVAKTLQAVLKESLTPIVCMGEHKRDTHGDYFSFVEKQLVAALQGVPKAKVARTVIAYEPIWAIGTGDTATAEDVREMKLFIHKVLVDHFGRTVASKVRILYGGSVKPNNASELLHVGEVDGFLIGGSSLKATDFLSIINTAETYAKA